MGAQFGDGEAAAVDGHRVSEGEFGGERDFDDEAGLLTLFFEREDFAGGFDEAGEHDWIQENYRRWSCAQLSIPWWQGAAGWCG